MQSLYDDPANELKVAGIVLMSVWELVLLRLDEPGEVGAALELAEVAPMVVLKAVRLKLPVVLKRAVASRTLAGQRSLQAPVIDCLTTKPSCNERLRTRQDIVLLYGSRVRCLRQYHSKTAKATGQDDEEEETSHILKQVEIDMAKEGSEWV